MVARLFCVQGVVGSEMGGIKAKPNIIFLLHLHDIPESQRNDKGDNAMITMDILLSFILEFFGRTSDRFGQSGAI